MVRKIGDRADGRLLRSLSPMHRVEPFIMVERNDATNHIKGKVEISEVEKYIKKKREQGYKGFGLMHFVIASYVRTISQRPAVNRIVSGQRIYARNNIEMNMDIKKEMTIEAPDTCIKVIFNPEDTAADVYNKIKTAIDREKGGELDSDFDNVAAALIRMPRIILKFGVWCLKTLDYFGLLPKALLSVSPFHGSFFYTSMGSLGIPPVIHHLYNFGNIPVFIATGPKLTEYEIDSKGNVVKKKYMEYIIVTDDRITDGFYYASAMKIFAGNFRHPEKLDVPPEVIYEDIY